MKNSILAAAIMLIAAAAPYAHANSTDTTGALSNATYTVEDGVVVISGTAEDKVEKQIIENIFKRLSEAENVRNELTIVKVEPEFESNIGSTDNL